MLHIENRFLGFWDFRHEQRFKAVELYLEGTDGDIAGGGGVDCQGLAARTHGAFNYVYQGCHVAVVFDIAG